MHASSSTPELKNRRRKKDIRFPLLVSAPLRLCLSTLNLEAVLTDTRVSEGAVASGEDKKKKKNMFSFVMPNKNKKTKEKDDLQGEGQLSDPLTWKKSFDTLLHDKDGLEQFRRFLTTEFSSENIEFWIACEEYREADKHELKEKAERIYEDFIRERSHRQVILNSQL
ncbi:DgyrCDS2017 [Dimorphilus gyrociliatus]|uniref:DgyrCDS2017 n=1 Tax=Dimorphilus gyrociliatus TaxID=2664684 RepID=A0A7I8VC52_9ANNE|nr:DgyrCDS2017 [Dimorphilus gyrociliatus]